MKIFIIISSLIEILYAYKLSNQYIRQSLRPQDFGAIGNGTHDDTAAMLATLNACIKLNGCDLIIDSNYTFLTGPLTLPTNIDLELNGRILALPMHEWLSKGYNSAALLMGENIESINVHGRGVIEGNGEAWWNVTHDDLHYRPNLFTMSSCTNFTVQQVTFLNSPNHNLQFAGCNQVKIHDINILAAASSPNTDGINFAGGSQISFTDSYVSNGDDCVSIVTYHDGTRVYGGNVHVQNITCVNSHGMSIGSMTEGIIQNVTFDNITMINGENGARIKTYPNHTGEISNITFSNFKLYNPNMGIHIDGKYCPTSQRPYPCPEGDLAIVIHNITFENITGIAETAGIFNCSHISPCSSIELKNVQLKASHGFWCSNVTGTSQGNVSPSNCIA